MAAWTLDDLRELGRSLARSTKTALSAQVDPLRAELDQVKKRLDELEARPQLQYRGTWSPDATYGPGDLVTDRGSCWYAKVESCGVRPGDGHAFQLVAKRGRDGRDAR